MLKIVRRPFSHAAHIPIRFQPFSIPTPVSADEAVRCVQSNDNVFLHTAAACPTILLEALARRLDNDPPNSLTNVRLHHMHIEGPTPFLRHPEYIRSNSLFIGANMRNAVNAKDADATSIFLSEIPLLFRRRKLPLDVAFVSCSPFDKHGFASLGVSVDSSVAAVESAKTVVAVVRKSMPRTHGRGIIHASQVSYIVEDDSPIYEKHEVEDTKPMEGSSMTVAERIGAHCASLIPDGACLQLGIGSIPDAVLDSLRSHKDLGVHTELLGPGILPLVELGVVNNSKKEVFQGKIVASFAVGNRALYDFLDDNPLCHFDESSFVNDPAIIKRNSKMTSVNSCIEVDLTGQVVSDSIGTRMFSGFGGQTDFARGAALSEGGLPIIALPSSTSKGESRIVPTIKQGAGVVTTRAHVHYVCTEYGIVDLWGKSLRERAALLVSIAHPSAREGLEKAAFERFGKSVWTGYTLHSTKQA